MFSPNELNLTRRYLIWCYKTTKEDLDRIDRYFTQLEVDALLLKELKKDNSSTEGYSKLVDDFAAYMQAKKGNVLKKKFSDKKFTKLTAEYHYLQNRFKAIEKSIVQVLGKKELRKIAQLYEEEMTRRILQATEH